MKDMKYKTYQIRENTKRILSVDTVRAENILRMVKWHKIHCNHQCCISTYLFLEDFERHLNRKATKEELEFFL